jgi:hypothetical protein
LSFPFESEAVVDAAKRLTLDENTENALRSASLMVYCVLLLGWRGPLSGLLPCVSSP